ncbi:glycerate kinase [Paenibacillus rigui]|uniref:Glycerate kinase n=1 Tax=Paenibacillus rigui TaxID=554312 RepID=A0A229UGW0_9BACL|nr:glycerate kinase [Paenibacillus rigui]OXM82633.1 glycerate kinase [Paenibacillus rigui]
MRFVIAPDSFKGSLSSLEAGSIIQRAILQEIPDAETIVIPLADGGEGTVETLVTATDGRRVSIRLTGPLGDKVDTVYGVISGDTVALEVASICGLAMVPAPLRNPMHTTTRGVGELLCAALDQGYRKFIVGLGGSATNDGGLGLLQALGGRFTDPQGKEVGGGNGSSLLEIAGADLSSLDPRIRECDIQVACDVKNPLCGEQGATFIFGPQKGASPEQLTVLDPAMLRYALAIEAHLDQHGLHVTPGAGAAGGLGFAMLVLGAQLQPGAEVMSRAVQLREHLAQADWVITGEGRSDFQTLYGKLPIHVAGLAREAGVNALLLSGSLGQGHEQLYGAFTACFSIVHQPTTLEDCLDHAEAYLFDAAVNIARLLRTASR